MIQWSQYQRVYLHMVCAVLRENKPRGQRIINVDYTLLNVHDSKDPMQAIRLSIEYPGENVSSITKICKRCNDCMLLSVLDVKKLYMYKTAEHTKSGHTRRMPTRHWFETVYTHYIDGKENPVWKTHLRRVRIQKTFGRFPPMLLLIGQWGTGFQCVVKACLAEMIVCAQCPWNVWMASGNQKPFLQHIHASVLRQMILNPLTHILIESNTQRQCSSHLFKSGIAVLGEVAHHPVNNCVLE